MKPSKAMVVVYLIAFVFISVNASLKYTSGIDIEQHEPIAIIITGGLAIWELMRLRKQNKRKGNRGR